MSTASTLAQGPPGDDDDDLAQEICDNVTELLDSGTEQNDVLDLTVSATLPGEGAPVTSTILNVPAAGPFPDFDLEFPCPQVTLTVTKAGSGSVSSEDGAIQCGATCSASYSQGSQTTLTASPSAYFQSWSGSCSGSSATTSLTMYGNALCAAQFSAGSLAVTDLGPGSGTVSSLPAGIICGGTCSALFPINSTVTLTAVAAGGSIFQGWGGSCSGAGLTATVVVGTDMSCSATFGTPERTLTVNSSGIGTGTITSSPSGIACSSCSAHFPSGMTIVLTASTPQNSTFSGWGGDCSGSSSVVTIVLSVDLSCTAYFGLATNMLTVTLNGAGVGSVISTPAGISCNNASCSSIFPHGAAVTLNAAAGNGSTFVGWSGDCTGDAATTVATVLVDKTCIATFGLVSDTLTIVEIGGGAGTVTSSPAGINCGSTCSATFAYGAAVTLAATPSTGSYFTGWSGDCNSSGAVTLFGSKSCAANFGLASETLTAIKNGNGSGTLTSSPVGINCGSTCSASFAYGTIITLKATPTSGSLFTGWSGDCNSSGVVTLSGNKSCTATFNGGYPLTLIVTGAGFINEIYDPSEARLSKPVPGLVRFNFRQATLYI